MPPKKKSDPPKQIALFGMQPYEDRDAAARKLLIRILALEAIKGVGFKTICSLIDAGYIETIWQSGLGEIEAMLSSMPAKNKAEITKEIFEKSSVLLEQGEKKAEWIAQKGISFIPEGHPYYPHAFKRLTPPPRWIFVRGNIQILHSSSIVGIVGTREATSEGKRLAYACSKEMVSKNVIVLSGLARGIDEQAHQAAIDYFGQTIGILGHGLTPNFFSPNDYLMNYIVERDGAIVSEYLLEDPAAKENFLRRNELQAALSGVIIPIECPSLNSGTGATIRRAMHLGTPVMGIFPDTMQDHFKVTANNLQSLGLPVFYTPSMRNEFWSFLKDKLSGHDWAQDATDRQNRMIRLVKEDLLTQMELAGFDDVAIDRLAQELKKAFLTRGKKND